MNRIALFAHYDKDNLIEDYVVYYLQELKKVANNIIFVSDSNISDKELEKINNIVDHSIVGKHGEYDFGSYKRGYQLAKEFGYLKDFDELVICNDSCYGPLYPFEDIFNTMSPKELDFWGLTENPEGLVLEDNSFKTSNLPHVQSFFVVLKPQVFNSEIFDKFITSVQKEEIKNLIITKYEQGLTTLLTENGFKYDVYCQNSKNFANPHLEIYEQLITDEKSPLVKTSIYRQISRPKYSSNYKLIEKKTNYDVQLIKKDIERNKKPFTFKEFVKYIFSLNNTSTYKIIVICGFVIKIKRKKINK